MKLENENSNEAEKPQLNIPSKYCCSGDNL